MSISWKKIKSSITDESNKFLIAVSGGVDSMFLLDFCKKAFGDTGIFGVVHFNHNIRNDSHEDELLVKTYCEDNNIPLFIGTTNELSSGSNIELRARELRWSFFEKIAMEHGYDTVLTGHHLNDYVENYLMGTIRGIDIISCVMPQKHARNGIKRFKPFLKTLSKDKIYELAKYRKLTWREDSTNKENDNLRNMVRNVMIPEMMKSHNVLVTIPKTIKSLEEKL